MAHFEDKHKNEKISYKKVVNPSSKASKNNRFISQQELNARSADQWVSREALIEKALKQVPVPGSETDPTSEAASVSEVKKTVEINPAPLGTQAEVNQKNEEDSSVTPPLSPLSIPPETSSDEVFGKSDDFGGWRGFFKVFQTEATSENHTDVAWQADAHLAILEQRPLRARQLLYGIALAVVALVTWAGFANIDQVTRGEGKVIPSQKVQIIQSLDGGVITQIDVAEGDIVQQGQLLVKLDATRFVANYRESRAELLALEARILRLNAIAQDKTFEPTAELLNDATNIIEQEQALFDANKEELSVLNTIAEKQIVQREQELKEAEAHYKQATQSVKLTEKELVITRPLVDSGAVSEVELLRLEREIANLIGDRDQAFAQSQRLSAAIAEAEQQRREVELEYKNALRNELTETLTRMNALKESSLGLSDRVKQTDVRSPVRGTVKRLFHNTIGGVVSPGKEVIEIVPLDDSLLLEARIKPKDIAFLGPGQLANVKFTAYDFVIYGGLKATVEHIGADTVMDEDGKPFYMVKVRTEHAELGEGKPIIPGMVATIDILTGKKTILSYLFKPVLRAKEYALTER